MEYLVRTKVILVLASVVACGAWVGAAALDVEPIMRQRHPRLYDQAFGSDPAA